MVVQILCSLEVMPFFVLKSRKKWSQGGNHDEADKSIKQQCSIGAGR